MASSSAERGSERCLRLSIRRIFRYKMQLLIAIRHYISTQMSGWKTSKSISWTSWRMLPSQTSHASRNYLVSLSRMVSLRGQSSIVFGIHISTLAATLPLWVLRWIKKRDVDWSKNASRNRGLRYTCLGWWELAVLKSYLTKRRSSTLIHSSLHSTIHLIL